LFLVEKRFCGLRLLFVNIIDKNNTPPNHAFWKKKLKKNLAKSKIFDKKEPSGSLPGLNYEFARRKL
jgi:hypothetical protein